MPKNSIATLAFLSLSACLIFVVPGCGPAESVYPTGEFTEEQKSGAMKEYQSVEDEESKGNNAKKKPGKR